MPHLISELRHTFEKYGGDRDIDHLAIEELANSNTYLCAELRYNLVSVILIEHVA
jgi:hypothetical protein